MERRIAGARRVRSIKEGVTVKKSRLLLALGLALAMGVTGGIATASGGSGGGTPGGASAVDANPLQNGKPQPAVELRARAKPRRLPRRRFRNITNFTSVGHDNANGSPEVPKYTKALQIDFGKNVRFRPNKPRKCRRDLNGTTTREARRLCPRKSIIGTGTAHVRLPGPTNITDLRTLAIAGPRKNTLRFHAFSPTLSPSVTQVIRGKITRGARGKAFRWRLTVPKVPLILGGAGANTLFGVTIRRKTGVVQARCRAKRFVWRATWTFEDNSRKRDTLRQRCRRR